MIRNGDVELQAREEEIRFLKMQLQEERRCIDLLRKSMPSKRAFEQELVTLQIQVKTLCFLLALLTSFSEHCTCRFCQI